MVQGQGVAPGKEPERVTESGPVIVEQGADFRVVEWVTATTDESGEKLSITNRYTEVATGLHYRDEQGQWQQTVAEFVAVPNGFVAARGPHQVALSTELTVPGAVTVVTADGQTLRSSPALLAFTDRVSGESVLLAEVQPSRAEQIEPGTVLYANVLDSVPADLRTVYTAAGFECDLILREPLPDPAQYGLNPDTTDVEVYTEFFGSQPTAVAVREVPVGERESAADAQLTFGPMVMDRGRAFVLPGERDSREVPVRKSWEQREGREFLIERTAYRDLEPLLRELPGASAPTLPNRQRSRNVQRTAQLSIPSRVGVTPSWRRTEAGRLMAMNATSSPRAGVVAKNQPTVPGVVLDYTLVNSSPTQTFDSLTTYYVSGLVNLSSSVTFQAGTVIKYAKTNSPSLKVLAGTTVTWLGAPYRPVVLTGYDDNSVGEALPSSTGSPAGTYATKALELDGTGRTSPLILTNLCIRHADVGVAATYFSAANSILTLRHGQFVHCNGAFRFQLGFTGSSTYEVQNCLIYSTNPGSTAWRDLYYAKVSAEFLTFNALGSLQQSIYSPNYSTVSLANSLIYNVVNTAGVSLLNSGVPPANPFVTAGSGAHYLNLMDPTVRGWLDARPTSLQPPNTALATELAKSTVMAPVLLPSTVSFDLTVSGGPDPTLTSPELRIGYHYWPIHFLSSGVTVTGATVYLTNGVVVAGTGSALFNLGSASKVTSRGRPDSPNRFGWASIVQELPLGVPNPPTRSFLAVPSSGASVAPSIDLRFLRADSNADVANRRSLYTEVNTRPVASFILQDCQFYGVGLTFADVSVPQTLNCRNCFFSRSSVNISSLTTDARTLSFRNNLFLGGSVTVGVPLSGSGWTIRENLFDGASFSGWLSPGMTVGYNAYSDSTPWFGGSFNKVSIAAVYQSGPLGNYYYPATGGLTTLAALRNAGSQSANAAQLFHATTLPDQTKDGLDDPTKVDIGFHYPAVTGLVWADSDQDGLPDVVEDSDGDGVVDAGETNWTNADTDGDGALDGEEVAGSTNPKDKASWIPKRLAAWWWDGAGGTWRNGDRGQVPIQTGTETNPTGIVGNGVNLDASPGSPLRYAILEANGRPNLRLDQGSIRLYFKPDWAYPSLPAGEGQVLSVGEKNNAALGWWAWYFKFETTGEARLQLDQQLNQPNTQVFISSLLPWTGSPRWHELTASYNTSFIRHYEDGGQMASDYYTGIKTTLLPTASGINQGFRIGADGSGQSPLDGTIDSIETFNYSLESVEKFRAQQLTINVVTNLGVPRLEFRRNYEGMPAPSPHTPQDFGRLSSIRTPWPLTIFRRVLGNTNWGSPLLSNSTNSTWVDSSSVAGVAYEYKATFQQTWLGSQHRHISAGIEVPPQHQRGTALVLVDNTLASSLGVELAQLTTNLVGDGWMVKLWTNAPRHIDTNFAVNRPELTNVVNWIGTNYTTGSTNVVFIIGHVTIPYSGTWNDHSDHTVAWTCDGYYGFTNKMPWTDTNNVADNGFNDGKFDLNFLPGIPDFAVGRVDFSRLPVFSGLGEVDLIKRYLQKDFRFRRGETPTFGRVLSCLQNSWEAEGVNAASSFSGGFGVATGTLVSANTLSAKVPADLSVHFSNGGDDRVNDVGFLSAYTAANFADPSKELPVTFRNVWFSYASDWARLNSNGEFTFNDNWLRSSLGWPDHGLATMGGFRWDFSCLAAGAPLAETMKRGYWVEFGEWPRFQSILGDPTLRLYRVAPPGRLDVTRVGSTAMLSWTPSPMDGCTYYVYRSNAGLGGFSSPLNPSTPVSGMSFTDTGSATGVHYQVRACRLQVTGAGSFWNLSQGTFGVSP